MLLDPSLTMQLQNKHIVILGIGITGLACARFLHSKGIAFAVNDSRNNPINEKCFKDEFTEIPLSLGQWNEALIKRADIIITSPGIDLSENKIASNITENCQVWGDIEFFFRIVSAQGLTIPTLAVTGSNGKSTVVSLLAHLGDQLGYNICLAGNIGTPIFELLLQENAMSELSAIDCLILELSSFQLETLQSMCATGASILNISDDHLDRHKTLDNYQHIKQKIYLHAKTLVVNRDDPLTQPVVLPVEQKVVSFGYDQAKQQQFGLATIDGSVQLMFGDKKLIAVNKLPIAGTHNALNCLAALALGQSIGWSLTTMTQHLSSFKGLDHRCQTVLTDDGITWINDSKATNVGATLAAIDGLASIKLTNQQLILIAGGEGKGADFTPLTLALSNVVDHLITLGKDGDKIAALSTTNTSVNSVEQAVLIANKMAKQGDIVLLSPACASLDMFKNYQERGQAFCLAVQSLNVKHGVTY